MVKQRTSETADVVAVSVQGSCEALTLAIGDGRPGCTAWHGDIRLHKEFQVLTAVDLRLEQGVTCEVTRRCRGQQTQVKEILQLVHAVGCIRDVDLRITQAVQVRNINVVVMLLILHHLCQVMVVGHADLYLVRVGLTTDVRQCVVAQPVSVLIPVERIRIRYVFYAVVVIGIGFSLVQFPSTTLYG